MKKFLLSILLLPACASQELTALQDRNAIEDTIVSFAMRADAKDWKGVQELFTPRLQFTMSGGPESLKEVPREEMTGIWEQALKDIPVVHHQVGNIQVHVESKNAQASYYGISLQHKPNAKGGDIRGFVGSYKIRLQKEAGRWRISELVYANKMVGGNAGLH